MLGLSFSWFALAVIMGQATFLQSTRAGSLSSPKGVYNSSVTPASLPWNTYNYCNAPHVNAAHYSVPEDAPGATLVYANAVIRHHKRTPDNLYPEENALNAVAWNCSAMHQYSYGGGTGRVFHETYTPAWHPFLSEIWNGTCDEGQLTQEGLEDAVLHGKDFWSVYSDELGFLQTVNEDDIFIRTSTETRTFQVAGGLLAGMDSSMATRSFPVTTQPSPANSIPPAYPCPNADQIRDNFQSVPAWTDHLEQNAALQTRLGNMLGTANLSAWTSWYDHYFDTFTSRTCNGHPLPCNASGACVSVDNAAQVFSIGDFEYNYIWSAAENATTYTQLTFGVFLLELAHNFVLFRDGKEHYKLRFYVGHDGTMIRLASSLGLGAYASLRWPALGSEIVMEVWQTAEREHFVRVLHEGTPVPALAWVSLDGFVEMLQKQIPENVYQACTGS
ncbi:phosphoglycerate mutase-like protein [Amylocystis lapponica]|nr:phosphoglycerate mutase-like protein [Amylocystis lapponica]